MRPLEEKITNLYNPIWDIKILRLFNEGKY